MKIGQTVNYYTPRNGERQEATIVGIEGTGPSLAKVLKLKVGDNEVGNVPHGGDVEGTAPFWLIKGVESAPAGWADAEQLDIEDAVEDPIPPVKKRKK